MNPFNLFAAFQKNRWSGFRDPTPALNSKTFWQGYPSPLFHLLQISDKKWRVNEYVWFTPNVDSECWNSALEFQIRNLKRKNEMVGEDGKISMNNWMRVWKMTWCDGHPEDWSWVEQILSFMDIPFSSPFKLRQKCFKQFWPLNHWIWNGK
jgi:hypothetical protein